MVISEIQSLYRDDDDLLHTVIKRIYEAMASAPRAVGSQKD